MAKVRPSYITKENIQKFLKSFDNVLTDCDGVIWTGEDTIGKANEVIAKFKQLGKKVFYVTNNSTKSKKDFLAKCDRLNFQATAEEVLTPSVILAEYLKQKNFNKKVYVVGTTGITQELDEVGIQHTGVGPDPASDGGIKSVIDSIKLEPNVGAVVVGFDEHFSYPKIFKAASYLKDPSCIFIGTNTDEVFPLKDRDLVMPGTGCFVKCVEVVAGRQSEIMGKPSSRMFDVIRDKYNLDPSRTLMIGDRCNTDILFGKNCGLFTLVVLTGITTLEDIDIWCKSAVDDSDPNSELSRKLLADYCLESLDDLLNLMDDQ